MRNYISGVMVALGTLALLAMSPAAAKAQAAGAQGGAAAGAQGGAAKTPYTMPEYNAFTACQNEKDPNQQVKCFDDFSTRFPTSFLLQYAYPIEFTAYTTLKNCPKAMDAADKMIALTTAAVGDRLKMSLSRLQAFPACFDAKAADAQAQLTKDRDIAIAGPKLLAQLQKPANTSDTDWGNSVKQITNIFDNQAGWADLQLKDFAGAVAVYKDAMANKADDAAASYELGTAYLAMNPPQSIPGFWAIARAIDLKVPQADKVKDYLHSRILAYEQPGCDNQVDGQLSEMLQLAQNAPDPPSTYTIPTADDLSKIRSSSTILTIVGDLSAGGDKAKMTWLATCGSELSAVTGKVIDQTTGEGTVDFMVYTGATSEDMQAATTANMDVKVYTAAPATPPPASAGGTAPQITPQPDVVRLQKDDPITFSGTITSYDPSPFLLHWDDVKVDPASIPAPGKPAPARGRGRGAAPKN